MDKIIMAALVTSLAIAGACDSTGAPVAGGRAFLTVPGTANQAVPAYANHDATATVTLDNGGVPLDAGGRAAVFLNQPADIRVEDANGTTVATYKESGGTAPRVEVLNSGFTGVDPVSGQRVAGGRTYLDTVLSSIANSTGGTDGLFVAGSTGTQRTIQSKFLELQISVKDFGAVGDGRTDDTSACQAAIAAVIAAGGGTVFFPGGSYLISTSLKVTTKSISFLGVSASASVLKNGTTTGDVFYVTSVSPASFAQLGITASSNSSGVGIKIGIGGIVTMDSLSISNHASAVSSTGSATLTASNMTIIAATGSASGGLSWNGSATVIGSSFTNDTGPGISLTGNGSLVALGSVVSGGTYAIDLATGTSMFAYGVRNTGNSGTFGFRAASGTKTIFHQGCDWGTTGVSDGRTGAPVNYTVVSDTTITPLPSQTEVARISVTAAAVVTIGPIATMGFGRRFTLICSRATASAVTWTFDAQFHLSAAVAPTNGNRVMLLLEYDPVSNAVYEVGRGAVSN